MLKNKQYKLKLIAASLGLAAGLAASVSASAAMGGLQVQSRLDEPFSGTVVVTGDEARALAGSAKPAVIGANLTATVTHQGNDRAVVRLRSSAPVKEPVLTFWLNVGDQNRQYTAMLDPSDYRAPSAAAPAAQPRRAERAERAEARPARPAAEPRRRAEQRERERSRPRAAASGRVEVIQGERYQVKDGELLVNIAERVQPAGMTLRQTINALVRANPKSFRNGNPDLMYRGATLVIPDAAQLRRLAQDGSIRVRTQPAGAADAQPAPAPTAPPAAEQTPPAAQTAPPAAPETPPAAEQTPPPAETMPAASAPAPAASEAASAVSEPQAASTAVPDAASDASAASQVPASETVVAPVVEQTPPPQPPEPVPVAGEGMDMTQMALYGAGGLAVLGGLAYLLANRRRKAAQLAEDSVPAASGTAAADDADLFFEDIQDQSAGFGQAAAAPAPAPAPAAADAPQAPVQDNGLGLDLSHLEEQQHLGNTPDTESVSAVAAAQQPDDEDWSWLEDSSADAAKTASAAAAVAATAAVAGTAADAAKADEDWLNFGGDDLLPEAAAAPAAEAPAVAEEDLDWVFDEQAAQPAAPAAEAVPQSGGFGLDAAETAAPAVPEETAFDLSFDLDDTPAEAAAPSATADSWVAEAAAEPALDFSAPDTQAAFETAPAAAEPVAAGFDGHAETLDFDLNFVDESQLGSSTPEPQVAAWVEPEVQPQPAADFGFADDAVQAEAEAQGWEEALHDTAAAAALPQEALEAKLELAKMYLEIDDANTARQTLMELINESNGSSIQAQAQALLNELG